MYIEIVFPENVVRCKFAEVDFVEPVPIFYMGKGAWMTERGGLTLLDRDG